MFGTQKLFCLFGIKPLLKTVMNCQLSKICWQFKLLKNMARHTMHTIVSWPNPKQWLMVHNFHSYSIYTMLSRCHLSSGTDPRRVTQNNIGIQIVFLSQYILIATSANLFNYANQLHVLCLSGSFCFTPIVNNLDKSGQTWNKITLNVSVTNTNICG